MTLTSKTTMTDKDFINLAIRMREQNILYFKTRHSSYLQTSKMLEREFDAEVKRREQEEEMKRNPRLFG